MPLVPLLRAMRPHQWVKNVFVLAALVFAGGVAEGAGREVHIVPVLLAVAAFCLGSSAIYLLNDVLDVESDRAHPSKCKRPVAAGLLPVPTALAAAGVSAAAGVGLAWAAGGQPVPVVWVLCAYLVLNLAYTLRLKHVVLLDVFCIASGFLFRVQAGASAVGVPVSHWLFLCTLFLALFLALCKRRAEIDLLGDDRGDHRAILTQYTTGFLDQMVTLVAACTIVAYTMYTVSDDTAHNFGEDHHLIVTVPFVVFGLARYMLLVQTQRGGGSPTRVLLGGDLQFVLNALAYGGVVLLDLYGSW
ncbi:MAG: decaprenyl-phosphate phosphoribosyltransferase [Planctomycetes bacterium]|nr:decaprenyl-phosphate phosphoribosyltransferase [Planctomycetota bacterium]MCB9904277.1 decaprenyl-phosphate phosphoribosyltransferase [Planctomycetota bacterium]